jgi:hypothetical protein
MHAVRKPEWKKQTSNSKAQMKDNIKMELADIMLEYLNQFTWLRIGSSGE